jgi:hypothetical protein
MILLIAQTFMPGSKIIGGFGFSHIMSYDEAIDLVFMVYLTRSFSKWSL